MKLISTLLLILTLSLTGCGDADIQGNAFIIKGSGDIIPVAGQTVYLIPEKSVDSLLARAVNGVSPKIMKELKGNLEPLCAPTLKITATFDNLLKEEVSNINDKGNIPASGCLPLQSEVSQLNSTLQSVKSSHMEKISVFESELKKLQSKRSTKVKLAAEKLEKQAFKKLIVKVKNIDESGYYRYKVTIKNNTNYYLNSGDIMYRFGDIKLKLYSKGVELKSDNNCLLSRKEDKYGFDMGYEIDPNEVVTCTGSLPYISGAELKLIVEQKKLPIGGSSSSLGQLLIDKVVVNSSIIFKYKPTKRKVGGKIKYTSKVVSFYNIASRKKYSEDARIAELKKSIAEDNKKFEENDVKRKYTVAKTKYDTCNTDLEALNEANNKLSTLNQVKVDMDNCIAGKIDTKLLYRALKDFAAITNLPTLDLPEIDLLINDAVPKEAIRIIVNEAIQKTDTTIKGLFKFNKVPKGDYLLYTDYHDSYVDGFWLTPITVKENAQFDLNNNTLISGKLELYLTDVRAKIRDL